MSSRAAGAGLLLLGCWLLLLAGPSCTRAAHLPADVSAVLGRRGGGGGGDVSAFLLRAGRGLELGGRRYRLHLRYTACTGLVNQQYSHIAAFTLAAALGVSEVHLPPAAVRDSFGHKSSIHQEQNQMQWFPARTGCLLDVERLQRTWAALGITVHEVRAVAFCKLQRARHRPAGAQGWVAPASVLSFWAEKPHIQALSNGTCTCRRPSRCTKTYSLWRPAAAGHAAALPRPHAPRGRLPADPRARH